MTRQEEWNEFLMRLRLRYWEEAKKTREYEYRKQREEELEGLLAADRAGENLYAQGMRDCVWMLKALGVLV